MALPSSHNKAQYYYPNPRIAVVIPHIVSMSSPRENRSCERPENQITSTTEGEIELGDESPGDKTSTMRDVHEGPTVPPHTGEPKSIGGAKPKKLKKGARPDPTRNDPSINEVVEVAIQFAGAECQHRQGKLPSAFDTMGRLKHGWGSLDEMVKKVKGPAADEVLRLLKPTKTPHEKLPIEDNTPAPAKKPKNSITAKKLAKKQRKSEAHSTSMADTGIGCDSISVETPGETDEQLSRQELEIVEKSSSIDASHFSNPASGLTDFAGGGVQVEPISVHEWPQSIICSDQSCTKKKFNAKDLGYCGIELGEALGIKRRDHWWLCPG